MADANPAINLMLEAEGAYSNDPGDYGGETVWGVDYANNQNEKEIWERLAELKKDATFPENVYDDKEILGLCVSYYNRLFARLHFGDICSQPLANQVFGAYHNQGPQVIKWLQLSLKALKQPITVDGLMGEDTVNAINNVIAEGHQAYLIDLFNSFRKVRIAQYSDTRFVVGLLNRINKGA